MIKALYSGISGLRASANRVASSAGNIANVNTTGYKKTESINVSLSGNQGTVTAAVKQATSQGYNSYTGNSLDAAIQGEGFFVVQTPDGRTGYTRNGSFRTDNQGRLTDTNGNVLQPEIKIPSNAQNVSIGSDGTVSATVDGKETTLGQIQTASFNNPSGLANGGGGIYFESASSGSAVTGQPGTGGLGSILSGSLEGSNVDITEEIVNLITSKHAYSASLKTIEVADELLGSAIDIKS